MKRILGIDWGEKKMGVSVSDLLHITASGVGVFYGDKEEKMKKIGELIKNMMLKRLCLGFQYLYQEKLKIKVKWLLK